MIEEKTTKNRRLIFLEDNSNRYFIVLILIVIGTGIVFRSLGLHNSLWNDEAGWATRLVNNSLISFGFRPVGFMAVTKLLVNIKNNEFTLRLIPYLSSIFTIFLTYLIANEIFKSKTTIFLAVFIVSFNPLLISFAKEFKPYSEELFLHMLVILCVLYLIKKRFDLTPYRIIGILLIILPFAYNIVFLYPSVFLLLLLEAYEKKDVKELKALISIICLGLGGMLLAYIFYWSHFTGESTETYWGKKYDVFYLSNDLINHVKWLIKKYSGLIWASGRAEVFWDFLSIKYIVSSRISILTNTVEDRFINVLLLTAHFIGLISMIYQKKIKYILMFVLPIIVVTLFNVMGIWPFGPFRTNLFLFCYFLFISLYGIDTFMTISNKRFKWCMQVLIVIIIFMQLPFKPEYYKLKMYSNSDIKSVLNTISDMDYNDRLHRDNNLENQKRVIIAEHLSYRTIKYYLENHSKYSNRRNNKFNDFDLLYVKSIREINNAINSLSDDYLNAKEPVWIVNSYRDIGKMDKYLIKDNIISNKLFKKDQREPARYLHELIYYYPYRASNILTLDHENGYRDIIDVKDMKLKSEMRSGKKVLVAKISGQDSCFNIQEIEYPKDKFLSISVQIESPAQTDFRIVYMTESDRQYRESNNVSIWLQYGKNTLAAVINDTNIQGEIRICPGKIPGDYVISEIKIDSVYNL